MSSGPSLRQLRYFVHVADSGSTTAAARALGVTQSALSDSLRKLEREIGVDLFRRTGRGMDLSPAGARLLDKAQALLNQASEFVDTARSMSLDRSDGVTIAAPPGTASAVLGPLVKAFARRRPGAQVLVARTYGLTDTIDAVRNQEADLGLLPRVPVPADLGGHDVGTCEWAAVLPPALRLPHGGFDLERLDGLPFITGVPGTISSRLLDAALLRGAHPRVVMTEPDVALLPRLVAHGIGAAIVPLSFVPEIRALGLHIRLLEPRERWPIRLIYRLRPLSPATQAFVLTSRTTRSASTSAQRAAASD